MKRMRSRKALLWAPLVLLATATAVAAAVKYDLLATTIFGWMTSGLHDTIDVYTVPGKVCAAVLEPANVEEVQGTAGNYFDVVSAAYPEADGWVYSSAANPLSADTLRVRTYDVQGTAARVGAQIHITYTPTAVDPSTDIHWIQVVTDNHKIGAGGGHGVPDNKVDVLPPVGTPYYDDGAAASGGTCAPDCDFYDFPGRGDAENDHDWEAVLFLVQGPDPLFAPGAVTFLGPGVRWGWENGCVPEEVVQRYVAKVLNGPVTFGTGDAIAPGATVTMSAEQGGSMLLTKDGLDVEVFLDFANVSVKIDEAIAPPSSEGGNFSTFTVLQGFGQFAPYVFGTDQIPTSTFTVLGGEGFVDWGTNEFSGEMRVAVDALGFASFEVQAVGRGTFDPQNGIAILTEGDAAEIQVTPNLPALGLLGSGLLAVVVLAAGVRVVHRRRRRTR